MAVTGIDHGYNLAAAADTLDNATVGDGSTDPFKTRVRKVILVRDATAGTAVTTIRSGGSTGDILYSLAATISATTEALSFDNGHDIVDLSVSAITEGTTVNVLIV